MDAANFRFVSADAALIADSARQVRREGTHGRIDDTAMPNMYYRDEVGERRVDGDGPQPRGYLGPRRSGRIDLVCSTVCALHDFLTARTTTQSMPKYSTGGGGGGDDGDACELCGRETGQLQKATVAGARLLVCSNCRPHDDAGNAPSGGDSRGGNAGGSPGGAGSGSSPTESRKKELARKQAEMYDSATGDSKRWEEEGTNYEADRLPYLVSGYGDVVTEARQDAGLTVEEVAAELEVDEDDLLAVEDGRAATADVGGSVVRALEERFGVTVVDE